MRRYRHRDGSLRVWFGPEEIDQMAEEALHRAGLLPRLEAPVVDVERFLEGYLGADLDQYAPLPHDVLGATEFRPGVPPLVQVNAALTRAALDDPHPPPGSRGRWRATLAHEAGHVLLHRALVEPDPSQTSLFDPPDRLFRCLQREVAFGGGSDWREVQANRFMAALLMPKSVFVAAVVRAKRQEGLLLTDPVGTGSVERVARTLARWFDVSRQAARIRLLELGLVETPGQRNLYRHPPS
ncbi:MAG: ImmA/IrrE family metallo-endopeptidase [Armatimonadota bacterium]|nr:ImmA/IrrE family metallo-endopeptidase [Armatimonadota bacterium]MDR7425894.1 ImmA/IrrE family metallo-endopeptidase [Armatimonadota bacterium]